MNHQDFIGSPFANNDGVGGLSANNNSGSGKKQKAVKQLRQEDLPQYEPPVDGLSVVLLPSEFMPAQSINALPPDYFVATYGFYKYFDKEQRTVGGGVAAPSHLALANTENCHKWKAFFCSNVFGQEFKETMKLAFDIAVSAPAASDGFKSGNGLQEPRTFDHVKQILYGKQMTNMIAEGKTAEVISYAWRWVYQLTKETGPHDWLRDAIESYFAAHDMRVLLTHDLHSKARTNSIVRYAKKIASNSYMTTFKKIQLARWGFILKINAVMQDGMYPDNSGTWSHYNLDPYLSPECKMAMKRGGGTIFLTKSIEPKSAIVRVRELLNDAVVHARNAHIGNEELLQMMKESVNDERPYMPHSIIPTDTYYTDTVRALPLTIAGPTFLIAPPVKDPTEMSDVRILQEAVGKREATLSSWSIPQGLTKSDAAAENTTTTTCDDNQREEEERNQFIENVGGNFEFNNNDGVTWSVGDADGGLEYDSGTLFNNEDRGVLNGDDDDGLTRTVSPLFIILYIIQTSNRNTNTILSQRHN